MLILPREFAYFALALVDVFVGLLVGVDVVCWLLSALSGGCWARFGGSRGGAQGGLKRPEGKVSRYVGVSCGYNRKITQDNGDQLDTFPLSCGYLGPRWVADGRRYSQMAQHGFNITPVALFSVNFCVLGGLVLSKNGDFT